MRVIGTAGHVDHGKSTLVERLTGIDPDRLAEEKARGLTLDLGFAWLTLDDGMMVGIVDVPGHRDFIENMLAGVGGIDAALLVIAADEGVMPQTREHLAILDLLGVERCLVVLSKVDMVDDEAWLEMVEQDIREVLQVTRFADAVIVRVSAHRGDGLEELKRSIMALLADLPHKPDRQQPRLPIDRVFTVAGFGTVVTGTLSGGTLSVGDVVEIQPQGIRSRIRGLQSYKQTIDTALQGSRVAVNLVGVSKDELERGDLLAYPKQVKPTHLIDVRFRHLPSTGRALKHNTEVKFFCGASETVAQLRLLDAETLPPDSEGWLQLRLRDALPLTQGDRFILRYPSPAETLGGGVIVNVQPERRWRRFRPEVLEGLALRLQGSPLERLIQLCWQPIGRETLQAELGLHQEAFEALVQEALEKEQVVVIGQDIWARAQFEGTQSAVWTLLDEYHQAHPLRLGVGLEEIRQRLDIRSDMMNVVIGSPEFEQVGGMLRLQGHTVKFTPTQEAHRQKIVALLEASPYSPPGYKSLCEATDEAVLKALIHLGEVVQVDAQLVFSRGAYKAMVGEVLAIIERDGDVDASRLRDVLGSSRKYVIGLLEYLDQRHITKRRGDVRVRGTKADY